MCPAFTQGDYDAFCWSLHVVAGNRSLSLPRYSRAYLGYNLPLRKPLRIHPKGSGFEGPQGFSPIWLIDQHAPSSRTPIVLNRALGCFGLLRRCLSDERAQPLVRY